MVVTVQRGIVGSRNCKIDNLKALSSRSVFVYLICNKLWGFLVHFLKNSLSFIMANFNEVGVKINSNAPLLANISKNISILGNTKNLGQALIKYDVGILQFPILKTKIFVKNLNNINLMCPICKYVTCSQQSQVCCYSTAI